MNSLPEIEKMDTPEGHQRFLRSEWRNLAAFAWAKYQREGRGAVVIDLRRASKTASGFEIPTYYMADGSERIIKRGGWPDGDIAEAISYYLPDQEAVFLFLRLDGEIFHYIASDHPLPPAAHKARQIASNP